METQTKNRNGSMKIFLSMLIMVSAFLMMGAGAQALDWHTANQTTVAWDAVTLNTAGDPIPADNTIEYKVYLANAITDPNKANPVEIYVGSETVYTITLADEGQYFVGLQTIRRLENVVVGESILVWSDDPAATGAGGEFGIRYFISPAHPTGMTRQ